MAVWGCSSDSDSTSSSQSTFAAAAEPAWAIDWSSNETAQIRYYSADKGGVYTILKNVTLNNDIQVEHITF